MKTKLPNGLKPDDFRRAVIVDRHYEAAAHLISELLPRTDRRLIRCDLGRREPENFTSMGVCRVHPESAAVLIGELLEISKHK